MQELLPDYIFDRISPDDRQMFEANLPLYPDLQEEIKDTRSVFRKLEGMDFNAHIQEKTKYLSYKVINRMQKESPRAKRSGIIYRFVVPSIGLAFALLVFITTRDNNTVGSTSEIARSQKSDAGTRNAQELSILSPSDFSFFKDKPMNEKDIVKATATYSNDVAMDNVTAALEDNNSKLDDMINNYVADNLTTAIDKQNTGAVVNAVTGSDNEFYEQLSNLSEDQFQNILEALENAKISV
jgi:hypothetical protein